jgi:hypothetical protein
LYQKGKFFFVAELYTIFAILSEAKNPCLLCAGKDF